MKKYSSGKPLICLYTFILLLSFTDAAVYLSMKPIWFFISKTLGTQFGAISLSVLFIAFFIYSLILLILYIKKQRNGFYHSSIMNTVLPMVLAFILSAADIYLFIMMGSGQSVVLRNLLAALPYAMTSAGIIFFIVFYPELKISHSKRFKYIAAAVLVLSLLLQVMNTGRVKITAGPYIQLVDDSSLAVFWITNKKSTGFLEYGQDENNLTRIFSSKNGVIEANNTVHKVIVPIDKQSDFLYRVGSTKINNYYQNNVEYGNTAVSSFKKYSDYRLKDKITFYVLNDVHENENIYRRFLSKDDYDFIVLNGDSISSVDNKSIIIDKLLKPLASATNGTKPFYLVRGNHETRGASLRDLPDYIALPENRFYYTFSFGPVFAIVLDSGEDKPDTHEEYSGLADFEKYRQNETAWLQELSGNDTYKDALFKIAFAHIPLNFYENEIDDSYLKDYQKKWRELLSGMKIDATFSGHMHIPEVIDPYDGSYDFPTFIGGGEYGMDEDYAAIKVEVTNERMSINYVRYDDSIIDKYEIMKQK